MIKIYTTDEFEKWNEIVQSFKRYDIYYLCGYALACESHGDGQANLIYYNHENTRAIKVVMKRKINENYYDFTTPYGYGGFLVEGNEENVLQEYFKYCSDNNIVSEFMRFSPILDNKSEDAIMAGKTVYIEINQSDMLEKFDPKCRTKIRKAIKNNINIFSTSNEQLIEVFMQIYKLTMDKDNATDYYYFEKEYYDILFKKLKNNIKLYYAKKDEEIIAMSIIFFTEKIAQYHLSCALPNYMNLAPTNLILYQVSLDCYKSGIDIIHLGGGLGGKEDSLYKFKKSFNKKGNDLEFYLGKKIYNKEVYENLCKEKNIELNESEYFPAYRKP